SAISGRPVTTAPNLQVQGKRRQKNPPVIRRTEMSTKILNHRKLKRKKSLQNSVKTNPVLILHPERIPMRIWVPVSLLSTTPKKNRQNVKMPHPLQTKKRNLGKTPAVIQVN